MSRDKPTNLNHQTMNQCVMNFKLFLPLLLLFAMKAQAAPNEAIIREMSRETQLPEDEIRSNYDACDSGITLKMKICGSYRFMVEDARLGKVYKELLTRLRRSGNQSDTEQLLIRSQQAWLAYRDAACAYEGAAGAGGGSAEGLYVLACKADLTNERHRRLGAILRQ